ncbi:MAG: nucleoside-diphosphate sugar epimerase, partial [Burkholderiaceae bacterium]|nr:nucleoside-diphosphate sugar epimerase [Burkholderiaceae bacterium]
MSSSNTFIWVAGASGLVGRALLDVLALQPVQVHALLRRPQDLPPYPRLTQHKV